MSRRGPCYRKPSETIQCVLNVEEVYNTLLQSHLVHHSDYPLPVTPTLPQESRRTVHYDRTGTWHILHQAAELRLLRRYHSGPVCAPGDQRRRRKIAGGTVACCLRTIVTFTHPNMPVHAFPGYARQLSYLWIQGKLFGGDRIRWAKLRLEPSQHRHADDMEHQPCVECCRPVVVSQSAS